MVSTLVGATLAHADVPDAKEDCVIRNSALCEVNGVRSMIRGPCPETWKTIRPPGTEDCDALAAPVAQPQPPPQQPDVTPRSEPIRAQGSARDNQSLRPMGPNDMARFAATERWLLPTIILGVPSALVLAIAFLWWRSRRKRTPTGTRLVGGLATFAISVVVALPVASWASKSVFGKVFNSFDNHDTVAPFLLAAPVAVLTFAAVMTVVIGVVAFVLTSAMTFMGRPRA